MNIKDVKDLIQEILQSDISEFELEHTGTKMRLRRGSPHDTVVQTATPAVAPIHPHPVALAAPVAAISTPSEAKEESSEDSGLHFITSPIVGTFYRAPSPGADPYVKVGDKVEDGSILCVVEAMKLMNEIPSDMAGEVVRIYVENAHPVEFGQKLFGIRPRT